MKNLKERIQEIDSKLSEANDLVQDLYSELESEMDLEERDEAIAEAIGEYLETDDDDLIGSYFEVLRNLESLFE